MYADARFVGVGTLVMFPARSYAGVAQVMPTVAEMAEISLAGLAVLVWFSDTLPLAF